MQLSGDGGRVFIVFDQFNIRKNIYIDERMFYDDARDELGWLKSGCGSTRLTTTGNFEYQEENHR